MKKLLILTFLFIAFANAQTSLTNTFTYQGELKFNNALANGSFDFEFNVFDVDVGGTALETIVDTGVSVSNGVFTTPITLSNDLFTGNKIWLDIGVKANGSADPFDPLSPRQEVTSSPYAIHAQFVGTIGADAVGSVQILNGSVGSIDLASNSVTSLKITPNAVSGSKIQDFSVGTNDLASSSITTSKLALSAVTASKIAINSVTGDNIQNGTITASDVDTSSLQQRVGGSCASGQYMKSVNADGSVVCAVDNNTVAPAAWELGGNATSAGDFIGTINSEPFVVKVNNKQVFRVQDGVGFASAHSPNIIMGAKTNVITGLFVGSTISGGVSNTISQEDATIGGGRDNTSSGDSSAIGGGDGNTASGSYASVGSGFRNTASGSYASVVGGDQNFASGRYSSVPGGRFNYADGDYSFVGGFRAVVRDAATAGDSDGDEGTFIWSDATASLGNNFTSTGPNQFLIRASGGVGIGTNNPNGHQLNVMGSSYLRNSADTSTDADLVLGGSGSNAQGVLTSDLTHISSDLLITSNDDVTITLDDNNDEQGLFRVLDGLGSTVMQVSETGGVLFNVTGSGLNPPGFDIEQQGAIGVGLLVRQNSSDANLVLVNKGAGDIIKAFTGSGGGNLVFKVTNGGNVTADGSFTGGGADFAEYLPTKDANLQVTEVVGLSHGKLSRDTQNAQRVMVISSNPAFIGNDDKQDNSGKALAAFTGQVAVKIIGTVTAGDWLLASGLNDGTARAVTDDQLATIDISQIIGRAIEKGQNGQAKVLVGLPQQALMARQQQTIKQQQQQIAQLQQQQQAILSQINETESLKQELAEIKLLLKHKLSSELLAENNEVKDE